MADPLPPNTVINAFSFGPFLREVVNNTRLLLNNQAAQGALMAEDFTQLNQALSDLKDEVAGGITQMDKLFADLTAALGSGNQQAVDDATAAVQAQIQALKDAVTRDTEPPPPGP